MLGRAFLVVCLRWGWVLRDILGRRFGSWGFLVRCFGLFCWDKMLSRGLTDSVFPDTTTWFSFSFLAWLIERGNRNLVADPRSLKSHNFTSPLPWPLIRILSLRKSTLNASSFGQSMAVISQVSCRFLMRDTWLFAPTAKSTGVASGLDADDHWIWGLLPSRMYW